MSAADLLARHDVALVRAENPGPFTLDGTNTWVVGRDPAWVIDPGPALASHLDALAAELRARGGLGGIALTHDHPDHVEAAAPLQERMAREPGAAGPAGTADGPAGAARAPIAAARGEVDLLLSDGDRAGPLTVVATPGHAPDHLAFTVGGTLGFSGDAVLGSGSTLLIPEPGALAAQLASMERLRALRLGAICPGHGPLVEDPEAKLSEYVRHRLERERLLLGALGRGLRTVEELLDDAWADAPSALRAAATVTLAAHLDKLEDEGRLPEGVERPPWPLPLGGVGRP